MKLQCYVRVDAEGEVVVDNIERQLRLRVLGVFSGSRRVRFHGQLPPVEKYSVALPYVRQDLRYWLVFVTLCSNVNESKYELNPKLPKSKNSSTFLI